VPVEVLGRVLPRVDDGAIPPVPSVAGLGIAAEDRAMFEELAVTGARAMSSGSPNAPQSLVQAAESAEATAQVLFRVPQPVTIAAGNSVLVPIVARDVPARRVSLYQPATH